jgi:hypothetical protein
LSDLDKLPVEESICWFSSRPAWLLATHLSAKVILSGKLNRKKVALKGVGATKGARAAIEAAGGSVADIAVPDSGRGRILGNPGRNPGQDRKFGDLWRRLWFLLGALVVYRIGAHIPVPGIDPVKLAELFQGQQGGILGVFNLFSGGALSRFTSSRWASCPTFRRRSSCS